MKKFSIGIDLSLRSTGICVFSEEKVYFFVISNKEDNEKLLIKNKNDILEIVSNFRNELFQINLEGLSFNSVSQSKDILAGNYWLIRTELYEKFNDITLNIVPVTLWRNPLFSKEERKLIAEAKKELKNDKKNLELKKQADIKYQTYLKLPENIKNQIDSFQHGKYDLTDSYFISKFKI